MTKRNEIFQVQSAIMTCPFELHLPGIDLGQTPVCCVFDPAAVANAESITSQVLQQWSVRAQCDIAVPVPQVLLKLILSNARHAVPLACAVE